MDDYPFDVPCTTGSAVDWYLQRMKLSGITEAVARKCGFRLRTPEDDVIHIEVPYFTVDGVRTTLTRQRCMTSKTEYGPFQSTGKNKGKYWQPKGSRNQVYWPPLTDQTQELINPMCPLIVCEGEFKAIACKMATLKEGDGHETLVCGVPGTNLDENVFAMLRQIRCRGAGDEARIVFISVDWNATGRSKEDAEQIEFKLKKLFQTLGAKVVILRWQIEKGAGEQKLDEWLAAGGDLSAAMNESSRAKSLVDTEFEAVWDYLNSHYAIMHGSFIPLSNITQKYNITQLNTMEPQAVVQISPKKVLSPAETWNRQPKEQRNEVDGYIFVPAPLGVEPERYIWQEGKRLLNTAPPAFWHFPPWGADVPDCTPFLNLIKRLCQEHADWYLDFLAHCAQYPGERGCHIIIFKDDGGTGKSRLFETLDYAFGPYSGPIGDSLTSNFNALLEHYVIAWWSDPVITGGANRDLNSAFKNYSGDTVQVVNHKGGAKYVVKNYGRLHIATNLKWIVPVSSKERRFVVFGGIEPMPHAEAGAYMHWLLNEGGVEAIRLLLTQRDLSHFDIHAQGPSTCQRTQMEKDSALPLLRMLAGEIFADRDIWSAEQIRIIYKEQTGKSMEASEIGKEMETAGMPLRVVKVEGKTTRLRAIRNCEEWENAENKEWVANFKGEKF